MVSDIRRGFTGIAISHDHLIISQSCHFVFVELRYVPGMDNVGRCRRHMIVVPGQEQDPRQVLLVLPCIPHACGYTYSAIWPRSMLHRCHKNSGNC